MFQWILRASMLAPLLTLVACIETTSPFCTDMNKIDIPGLDRMYSMALLLDPAKDEMVSSFEVKHIGMGVYNFGAHLGAGEDVSVCKSGRWTIAELKTPFGTYQQTVLTLDPSGTLSTNQFIINRHILFADGIKFEIVQRPVAAVTKKIRSFLHLQAEPPTTPVLLIHNDGEQDNIIINKIASPMGLGYTAY